MGSRACRTHLRQKQAADKEGMLGQLNGADDTFVISPNDLQRARTQRFHVFRVDAKVALILLLDGCPSVEPSDHRLGLKCNGHGATHERTGEPRDEEARSAWL